jgi:hypothetical protein
MQVIRIGGLRVILERLVMRNVVFGWVSVAAGVSGVRIVKTTLKKPPGEIFRVQQITNVCAGQLYSTTTGRDVPLGIRVANDRSVNCLAG